jgi:hypothetical protein
METHRLRNVGWVGMKWKPTVPLKNGGFPLRSVEIRSVEKWWV